MVGSIAMIRIASRLATCGPLTTCPIRPAVAWSWRSQKTWRTDCGSARSAAACSTSTGPPGSGRPTATAPEGTDTVTLLLVVGADTGVSIEEAAAAVPSAFALHAAYPNPFNPQTVIPYDVPEAGRVVDDLQAAGRHEVVWDAAGWPSGVYFVRLEAEAAGGSVFTAVRTVVLLR